ncbi:MAG: adenylate/guanylate cyclase domain-containing protein, partial [Gammaproteobacteria bacterium]|nr:adenylate/guanylate cyclase domain-containing protein [Gammaproteobacteria bacterium]
DAQEKVLVNYYKHYNVYSFSGIIASLQAIQNGDLENVLIDPAELKNKYIFVGGSAAGLNDLKNTPIDARLPGVFIHASLASNILNQDFLIPANPVHTYILIVLFAIFTTLCVLFLKRPILKNGIPLLLAGVYGGGAYQLFANHMVIDMVAPLFSLAGAWASSFSALVLMEGREKRKFKKMMSQYLSPAVLSTVVDNHEEFAKAEVGSTENISILFSDIRSFTNLSEKLDAREVVEMLNYYFSSMTESIFHYEGTIDKFIGDAIMAFWGAPIKTGDHAEKATQSAIDMINRLEDVNQWLMNKGLDPIAIGIGIHTGEAILGNIGSENKLDYTIIGDNVNLASRIEGLTKHYGASVLITEDTYQQLQNPMPCFTVDLVRVKGKNKPIKVYQPLILPANPDQQALDKAHELAALNAEMFEHYVNQAWEQALTSLKRLPEDKLHQMFRERCEQYRNAPPTKNWDGVHTMTSK